MKLSGNIRKMKSALGDVVQYQLPLYNVLAPNHYIPLNELIGQKIRLTFENAIHCVVTGKKINKTFLSNFANLQSKS